MKRLLLLFLAGALLLPRAGQGFTFLGLGRPAKGGDPAVRKILKEITDRQPAPYGLPEETTFNYVWAQYAMSLLAAERCGYLPREEAVARLKGMLDAIQPLERYYGFSYDGYDLKTGRKTTDKIYFQGWWLFALAVLKNAYPELAPACERLLAEVDYEKSGLFNPNTRQLAADYWPEKKKLSSWIDLYWQPTGEFRTPYVAYTYLTGDITPWTRWVTPRTIDIEGHPILGVWHNFIFCSMLVHTEFPDVGYLERSWTELLEGLEVYRKKNGMTFYPTRAEPLEAWLDMETGGQPNVEHRIAKPWLAWFLRRNAPVMQKAFTPGHGVSLYCDNMNLYWSFGGDARPLDLTVGPGAYRLPFHVQLLPEKYDVANPPKLTSIQFIASCGRGGTAPRAPLRVELNGTPIASVPPGELGEEPRRVRRALKQVVLTNRQNTIEISCADADAARAYTLYAFASNLCPSAYVSRDGSAPAREAAARSPYFEITVDGQFDGGENPYALLARCAVVHGYYVWHEMLKDPKFLDTTVAWVGDYYDRVRLARVVHNITDLPVTVRYERPRDWKNARAIKVSDITDFRQGNVAPLVGRREIRWRAEPRHTYRISYSPDPR